MNSEVYMIDYTKPMVDGEVLNRDRWADTPLLEPVVEVPTINAYETQDIYASTVAPVPFANATFQVPAPDVVDEPPPLRTLDYSWQQPLIKQVADWMSLFVEDGQVTELRALNVEQTNGAKLTVSGFFQASKVDLMAMNAMELTGDATGVFFMLNPVNPDLLARRFNRVEVTKDSTSDKDIVCRRWLLIDADPVRPSGVSSTDEEKQQAWDVTRNVNQWLREQGWPEPILCDSGNGFHTLFRIDLPCDDGGLVKDVLQSLARRFDNGRVKLDTAVFNPARIVKLYGSISRKGDSLRARPHRRSGVLAVPSDMVVVAREQLVQVRGEVPQTVVQVPEAPTQANVVVPPNILASGARDDAMQRARSYLAKVPGGIEGQKGSNQTFKAACILVRFGLSDEDAMVLFREWNQKCEPPWEEKDLQRKLREARKKVGPARMTQRADGNPAIGVNEAADDPHRLAEIYLSKGRVDGVNTLLHWNGDWYRWDGAAYATVGDDEVRADLTQTIKAQFDQLNRVEQLRPVTEEQAESVRTPRVRKVTTALLTNTMQALKSLCFLTNRNEQPCWLDNEERVPAADVLVAQNGWAHVPSLIEGTGRLQPLTPNLFTTVALDYDIDVNALEPTEWLKFLNQLWPDDPDSIQLLQEWFGYNLTQDTRQQKMLMMVGPKRAGKSTIARVLAELVGRANVVGPTLNSLAGEYGLWALDNKPTAIIADARFSGRGGEQSIVVERLLSITGEDRQTFNRKYKSCLTTKLPTRFTILTNELPRLTDASGALPSRLLTLQLSRSWYGSEDINLADRLLQERAGIFRWALEGLRRLRQRGTFTQPASGAETITQMVELSSPVTAFVQDSCQLGVNQVIAKRTLFDMWRRWCQENGHEPGSQITFGRNLAAAFPQVRTSRPRENNARTTNYTGIGIARL